ASTSAFAHHPAADMVDAEIYSMIDETVSDTPHADLTFDDMGSDMDEVGAAVDAAAEISPMSEDIAMDSDVEPAIDTMTLLENIDTQNIN
ncbi:MAG: hypothetical protein ACN4GM_03780, partial [Gammaproteobacteria bacterium]